MDVLEQFSQWMEMYSNPELRRVECRPNTNDFMRERYFHFRDFISVAMVHGVDPRNITREFALWYYGGKDAL